MNLETLRGYLDTTTGTNIKQVFFDYPQILNEEVHKEHPFILWDIDNSKWTDNIREGISDVEIDVYIAIPYSEYGEDKLAAWDSCEVDLKAYLNLVSSLEFIKLDLTQVSKEYYPPNLMSVDEEIGMKYSVKMRLYC